MNPKRMKKRKRNRMINPESFFLPG